MPENRSIFAQCSKFEHCAFLLVAAGSFFTYNKKQILKKGVLRMEVCFTAEAAGGAVG